MMRPSVISKPSRQDPTGHITLDYLATKAMREAIDTVERVDVLRHYGLLKQRQRRNVILAEKTPRSNEHVFDPHPPPATPSFGLKTAADRWPVPEKDEGILSKFQSQKPIYEKIHKFESEIEESIKKKEMMKQEQARLAAMKKLTANTLNSNQNTSSNLQSLDYPSNTSRSSQHTPLNSFREDITKDIKSNNKPIKSKNSIINRPSDQFHRMHVLRETASADPHILQEYRAQRAANFVNSNISKLTMPLNDKSKQNTFNIGSDSSRIPKHMLAAEFVQQSSKEELHMLIQELSKTEEDIERQELKIGFHSRRKHYEAPTAVTHAVKSSSDPFRTYENINTSKKRLQC